MVPELKNVNEYADKFGKAERQGLTTTTTLNERQKRFQPKKVESFFPTFKTTSTKTSQKRSNVAKGDTDHLLSGDDDDIDDDVYDDDKYDAVKSLSSVIAWIDTSVFGNNFCSFLVILAQKDCYLR